MWSLLLLDIPFVAYLITEQRLNPSSKALWILVACLVPLLGWVACWYSRMLPHIRDGKADAT
ncbi:PLDc N-terminal domain-containing protein [Wenzhouxiangella sp. EGI_FJ10409]|uniref:PLDc N-terminal domain-containing protein n=1 Tax=Wenzhouxiangella sp. EGI_FJ10409 TaxID=3243767 RepID=UPI0035E0F0FC